MQLHSSCFIIMLHLLILISAVILDRWPDPLRLPKLPVSSNFLKNLATPPHVQLSCSSSWSTFTIVEAFNPWDLYLKIPFFFYILYTIFAGFLHFFCTFSMCAFHLELQLVCSSTIILHVGKQDSTVQCSGTQYNGTLLIFTGTRPKSRRQQKRCFPINAHTVHQKQNVIFLFAPTVPCHVENAIFFSEQV